MLDCCLGPRAGQSSTMGAGFAKEWLVAVAIQTLRPKMTSMDSYSNELPCFLISVRHEAQDQAGRGPRPRPLRCLGLTIETLSKYFKWECRITYPVGGICSAGYVNYSRKRITQTRAPYSFPVSNNRAFSDRFLAREASSTRSSGTS